MNYIAKIKTITGINWKKINLYILYLLWLTNIVVINLKYLICI